MGQGFGVGIVGVRVRGAGYGGLPCLPRAPGGVHRQRRGGSSPGRGRGLPIYEPGVQEWFLDGGFAGNGCVSQAIFRGP
jgi:hypothetical protein